MLVRIYTCQNATLLEITCRGSNYFKLQFPRTALISDNYPFVGQILSPNRTQVKYGSTIFFFFANTAAQSPIYTLPIYPIPAKVLLPIVFDTYVILKDEDDAD